MVWFIGLREEIERVRQAEIFKGCSNLFIVNIRCIGLPEFAGNDVHVDGTFRRAEPQPVIGGEGDLERQQPHLNKPAASVPVAVFFLLLVQSEHAGNRFVICRGFSAGKILVGKGKLAKIAAVYPPGVGGRLQRWHLQRWHNGFVANERDSGDGLNACRLQLIRVATLFNMQLTGNDLLATSVRVIGRAVPCHGDGKEGSAGVGLYRDVGKKPQILKRRAQRHVGEEFLFDACDRVLNPRHGDDTFRRGVCLRVVGGKEDHHAVFARVYIAAPFVLEAERAGNNDIRPLDLCFAAFEIPIKERVADVPLRGQRGRGGDDRFDERQKLSVGRMTGFANGLLRAGGLAAGAAACFGMAAVRGAGALMGSVVVGGPFAPAMIVHLPYGIDGFGVSRPIYHIAIPLIAFRTKIFRIPIRAIRPTLEGISVTGWNFVRYEERYLIFRADLALTWRRAAAAVGIVMQRIGVLGGSGTGCPEQRHCRFAVLGIANLTYIGAGFSHGSRCVAAILAMRVLAV